MSAEEKYEASLLLLAALCRSQVAICGVYWYGWEWVLGRAGGPGIEDGNESDTSSWSLTGGPNLKM
jgi:hypothetical protein